MKLILNIGLAVGATSSIAAHVAKEILAANGFLIESSTVLESDTEPTLVATVQAHALPRSVPLLNSLYQTAVDLKQDCIAAYHPDSLKGRLIGPKAAAWGAFNPEFFFLPNGQRLASPVATA